MKKTASWTVVALLALGIAGGVGHAQTISPRQAIGAAIVSDIVRDRQADRDARRTPYASSGYGSIESAAQAQDACSAKALYQAGAASRLIGQARASTMATGWEVEGAITSPDGDIPFVCSVRNGSVSGVLLRR